MGYSIIKINVDVDVDHDDLLTVVEQDGETQDFLTNLLDRQLNSVELIMDYIQNNLSDAERDAIASKFFPEAEKRDLAEYLRFYNIQGAELVGAIKKIFVPASINKIVKDLGGDEPTDAMRKAVEAELSRIDGCATSVIDIVSGTRAAIGW